MTTFSIIEGSGGGTILSAAAGNLLIAVLSDRSGTAHSNHTVTDDNGATWNKISSASYDNEIGDANARFTLSAWWRVADATDASGSFIVSGDDGTSNTMRLSVVEIEPSAAYDWTFQVASIAGSGTGDWNGLNSGDTSDPGGSDLFEIAIAGCRNSTSEPTTGNVNFSAQTDDLTEFLGGDNQITHVLAIEASGQTSGAKSATINSDGSGNEGICAVIVFSNGAIGGGEITRATGSGLTESRLLQRTRLFKALPQIDGWMMRRGVYQPEGRLAA